jgi:hypothetical protein
MIGLEQIRLLEGKISRAIDLIRVLKEENAALRKGLDSAQHRMKELETLVEGFKTDQKEIESVIVRTLKNLDELEETSAAKKLEPQREAPAAERSPQPAVMRAGLAPRSATPAEPQAVRRASVAESDVQKGELDIF